LQEVVKIQSQIDKEVRDIRKSYMKALRSVEKIKEKMNRLELKVSHNESSTGADRNALDSAIEDLNKVTDFQISESERAWVKYQQLERDCKIYGFEPAGLNELKAQCKKYDELASNLLCYSLAHFKRKTDND
jgi:hypothetical protein